MILRATTDVKPDNGHATTITDKHDARKRSHTNPFRAVRHGSRRLDRADQTLIGEPQNAPQSPQMSPIPARMPQPDQMASASAQSKGNERAHTSIGSPAIGWRLKDQTPPPPSSYRLTARETPSPRRLRPRAHAYAVLRRRLPRRRPDRERVTRRRRGDRAYGLSGTARCNPRARCSSPRRLETRIRATACVDDHGDRPACGVVGRFEQPDPPQDRGAACENTLFRPRPVVEKCC